MPKGKAETQEEYRQRIMEVVCGCLVEGKSLEQIVSAGIQDMPSRSGTIREWCADNAELAAMYARARDLQGDKLVETLPQLMADTVKKYLDEGWEPKDAIQMAKAVVDAEKWRIVKMLPKRYGDKVTHAGDEENPIKHIHDLTEEALIAIATGRSN